MRTHDPKPHATPEAPRMQQHPRLRAAAAFALVLVALAGVAAATFHHRYGRSTEDRLTQAADSVRSQMRGASSDRVILVEVDRRYTGLRWLDYDTHGWVVCLEAGEYEAPIGDHLIFDADGAYEIVPGFCPTRESGTEDLSDLRDALD